MRSRALACGTRECVLPPQDPARTRTTCPSGSALVQSSPCIRCPKPTPPGTWDPVRVGSPTWWRERGTRPSRGRPHPRFQPVRDALSAREAAGTAPQLGPGWVSPKCTRQGSGTPLLTHPSKEYLLVLGMSMMSTKPRFPAREGLGCGGTGRPGWGAGPEPALWGPGCHPRPSGAPPALPPPHPSQPSDLPSQPRWL